MIILTLKWLGTLIYNLPSWIHFFNLVFASFPLEYWTLFWNPLYYIFSRLLCPFWAAAGEKTTFFFIPSQKVSNEYLFLPTIKYTSTNGRIENLSIFPLVCHCHGALNLRNYRTQNPKREGKNKMGKNCNKFFGKKWK